jgi:D-alanyl-D-alanine carboxypeptidase (penicillin-binding protein 5/6)
MGFLPAALIGGVLILTAGTTTPVDQTAYGGPALQQPGVVVAGGAPQLPEVDAAAWVVADGYTGDVLAAHNAHLALPPASTLKLLTAITLLPDLDPTLSYTATDADASVEGSRVGLAPDETYTFDDLAHGLLLASGNDAAHALGELSGGQGTAVAAMNAEAERLGALDTVARTPHGLDEPGQFSTAYDLSLIARAVLADPELAELVRTATYEFPGMDGVPFQIQNRNRLLNDYTGAIGLKTGFTTEAGHTIAAAAERGDVQLIVTVFQPEEGRAEPIAEALLDWGFSAASTVEPVGILVTPEDVERLQVAASVAEPAAAPTTLDGATEAAQSQRAVGIQPADVAMAGASALAFLTVSLVLVRLAKRHRRRGRRYAAG